MDLTVDLRTLQAFSLLWLVIVPTPGANSLFITHVAVTRSAGHVGLAIAGNMCGILLLAVAALLGWSVILEAFPWLRRAVALLGGCYLIFFGWQLIKRGVGDDWRSAPQYENTDGKEGRRTFVLGLLTAVSNAQAILFITSIFATTGILHANLATGFAAIVVMIVCNASYLAMLGAAFQRPTIRRFYARFRGVLECAIGALFIVLGGKLVYRGLDAR